MHFSRNDFATARSAGHHRLISVSNVLLGTAARALALPVLLTRFVGAMLIADMRRTTGVAQICSEAVARVRRKA